MRLYRPVGLRELLRIFETGALKGFRLIARALAIDGREEWSPVFKSDANISLSAASIDAHPVL